MFREYPRDEAVESVRHVMLAQDLLRGARLWGVSYLEAIFLYHVPRVTTICRKGCGWW